MVFAASNVARLLLPLRFGAALAMAPWVDENIMLLGEGCLLCGVDKKWIDIIAYLFTGNSKKQKQAWKA